MPESAFVKIIARRPRSNRSNYPATCMLPGFASACAAVHGLPVNVCTICIIVLAKSSSWTLLPCNIKNCCSVCGGWGAAEEPHLSGVNDSIWSKSLTTKGAFSNSHKRIGKHMSFCTALIILVVRSESAQSKHRLKLSLTLQWPTFLIT